ncbi:MAG: hypothetical protein ACI9UV_002640 [Algoriphagus sp.]|jgi:hypothetical protein
MVKKEVKVAKNPLNNWVLVLIMCGWLGLAPFFPEPHIWGKIKWVVGGANGMKLIDWGDLILHGFPWVLLFRLIVLKLKNKSSRA